MRNAKPLLALATAGLLLMVFLSSNALMSQSPPDGQEPGAAIYRDAASSVLWIEVLDASGSVVGTGSGFLAEGGQVLTSAHVVATGTPRVRLGPVALNARAERLDLKQDLATLTIEGELALAGLPLAQHSPPPGTSVWVIGNPQGLERTITSGTTSGTRTEDGVSYLQLSAPVSPGSSGGPVLTADGKVVGLVRMTLRTGQNLNFAVPVEAIRAFLAGDVAQRSVETFQEAIQLLAQESGLSFASEGLSDPRGCALARSAISMAGSDKERWLQATSTAWKHFRVTDCLDEHLGWARKTYLMFGAGHEESFALYSAALMAGARRASDGTDLWREAVQAMEQEDKVRPRADWRFWADLAEAAENLPGMGATAEHALERAAAPCMQLALPSDGPELQANEGGQCRNRIGLLVFAHFSAQGKLDAARAGLGIATNVRETQSEDFELSRWLAGLEEHWLALANSYFQVGRFADASNAAATAADLWVELGTWHSAFEARCAAAFYAGRAHNDDDALRHGRDCIALSNRVENPDTLLLGIIHASLSRIFQARGLPDQVLVHTQQALALLDPEKNRSLMGSVLEKRASALLDLQRPSEALAAAQEALQLTDGSDASTHFVAGSAAFDLRDFTTAERYFRKAAELNPSNSAALYNVALCLENRGFRSDAALWYRKYLKLAPNGEKRPAIEKTLHEWGM
ncbi:MAG: tetratricopeptide repeat protein [Thermoanaerobaculia bacterium]|nr:MAG: tetratricopeptide repeat protein [Thermoanaerobaculia bacterium]MBZ0102114.1 serine protease [Thermoanaerobaculia bacterium]